MIKELAVTNPKVIYITEMYMLATIAMGAIVIMVCVLGVTGALTGTL